ncbi:gamma-aminobutyric acid type B receptor subunit 1 isoform X2 [Brevipalpus obovatus]|uniref:gamma-aminobutyric acid type B receptor subunit 1 isoform X2 n=1 Tax=Brevipalpus obovatus TaxID=246614 RepID=UPI003D9F1ADC
MFIRVLITFSALSVFFNDLVYCHVPAQGSRQQNELEPSPSNVYGPVERGPRKPLKKLFIGGFFPLTGSGGWLGGPGCLPAVRMAFDDVNKNRTILPGYFLELTQNDSKCDSGLASAVFYDMVYKPPKKILLLGGCSIVCSTLAETAKLYNLIVFGYGSSSPALSNRSRFPTFFRTHPSATIHNPTRVKLFQKFNWTRIGIIMQNEEVFETTAIDLEEQCKKAGIEVQRVLLTSSGPTDAVKTLARQDIRIIVGLFYASIAVEVLCEAYKQQLYGKQHVWFLIGWYDDNWYTGVSDTDCTVEQMLQVTQGHFTTEPLWLNHQIDQETVASTTPAKWLERYEKELEKIFGENYTKPDGYLEAPLAYDAVWAVAMGLHNTMAVLRKEGLSIDEFEYNKNNNSKHISSILRDSLKSVSFYGVSGLVKFTDEGDRITLTQIEQLVDNKYRKLGYHDIINDNLTLELAPKWLTGRPPSDRTIIRTQLKVVALPYLTILNAISLIGILFTIGLIYFNFKFRKFRYIQMSQPLSNYIMLVGCIGCLSCISLFGLDSQKIGQDYFTKLCHIRAIVLSLSFSLAFGAMFAKVWFAYQVSTQMEQSNRNKIENAQIILTISLFCLIDVIILSLWFWKSPMKRLTEKLEQIKPENPNESKIDTHNHDIMDEPTLERCDTDLIWYVVIFCYKGLLLLFGLFLSYETRSVKLRRLNDSRLVGMSIYNVVILCMITGPVSLVIVNHVDAHFAFIASTIISCCFISMGLIFVPKIVELFRKRGSHFSFGDSCMNGTFHETMTIQEQEERLRKLTQENEELQAKIAEKESQIDEVRKQMEEIIKKKEGDSNSKQTRKAVRIQEPEDQKVTSNIHIDPASDSGYMSARNSKPSDFETSESYL